MLVPPRVVDLRAVDIEFVRIPTANDIEPGAAMGHMIDGGNRLGRESRCRDGNMRGDENTNPPCNGASSGTVGECFVRPAPHVGLAAQSTPFGDRQDEFNSGFVREPVHFRDLIPVGAPTFRRCAERHTTGTIRTEQPELVGVAPKTIPHLCASLCPCSRWKQDDCAVHATRLATSLDDQTQQLDPVCRNNSLFPEGRDKLT